MRIKEVATRRLQAIRRSARLAQADFVVDDPKVGGALSAGRMIAPTGIDDRYIAVRAAARRLGPDDRKIDVVTSSSLSDARPAIDHPIYGQSAMTEHDAYREKLQAQLTQWDTRIEQVSARIELLEGNARGEARQQLQAFRAQRIEALARLQNWDEVRHGVDKAWYELARSFDTLSSRYK